LTGPSVSTDSNMPNLLNFQSVGPFPSYADNIAWQYGSFSVGPGSILAKIDLSSTNPTGGCISIVLKA
jgi:hypothetical protein